MAEIFFTSDTHYGHHNIIKYSGRPFDSVEEMNEELIQRFNAAVRPHDVVYHLGDFAFVNKPESILRRLTGNICLIKGNHDSEANLKNCKFGFIKDVYELKLGNRETIWLSHYAHLRWPRSHKGAYHLFGHSHGGLEGVGRSMDVGVDTRVAKYAPIHIDTVRKLLKDKPNGKHH